jgi:hypothetical protein
VRTFLTLWRTAAPAAPAAWALRPTVLHLAAVGAAAWLNTAVAAEPLPGRYAARMCVSVAAAQPDCGPAEAEWRGTRQMAVRISDIVYLLTLRDKRVDVVLMHGAMQIDGFSAPFTWQGDALQFVDADKNVRFDVQLQARQDKPRL